jgi:hypothetical protein
MEFNVKQLFKPSIAALLLMATIFTATGHLDRMINSAGLERLNRSNDQYLEESFNRSLFRRQSATEYAGGHGDCIEEILRSRVEYLNFV